MAALIEDALPIVKYQGLNTAKTITTAVAAGSFDITVINNNVASGTAETGAIIINFAVIKAVTA